MNYLDISIAEETMERRVQEGRADAEHQRLVRQLRAGQRPWTLRLACWLGCRLAARLIATGKTLERASLRPSRSPEIS